MSLPTAVAISGAAANPNTGGGGRGLARNRLVSTLMSLFNLRLGYWIRNPLLLADEGLPPWKRCLNKLRYWWVKAPSHFDALWHEVLGHFDGKGPLIQLSDGGHFENLGLYELIRRRLKVIIVVDASADPEFKFSSLHTALDRIGEDFGVWIDFENGERLRALIPQERESVQRGVFVAERGYATGIIHYPGEPERGVLIYIKSTLIEDVPLELLCYARANPQFPDETTVDQFFSEAQFEAYRTLGFIIAKRLIGDEEIGLERTMREAALSAQ